MVATSRGRLDMALQIGTDCQAYLSNGWTAKECPRQQGQEECKRLVAKYQVVVGRVVTEGGEVGTSLVNERI